MDMRSASDTITWTYPSKARTFLPGLLFAETYLIRGAPSRPDHSSNMFRRLTLGISSLGSLIDMYHVHEATQIYDKVFALLGMSLNDLTQSELPIDYSVPMETSMQRVLKHVISDKTIITIWHNKQLAMIERSDHILGVIHSVERDPIRSEWIV